MKKILLAIRIVSTACITLDDIFSKTGTNESAVKQSIIQAAISLQN